MCGCLLLAPYWGPGLQPKHVPWLGIKPVTLCFAIWHSIHWATPSRANHLNLTYFSPGLILFGGYWLLESEVFLLSDNTKYRIQFWDRVCEVNVTAENRSIHLAFSRLRPSLTLSNVSLATDFLEKIPFLYSKCQVGFLYILYSLNFTYLFIYLFICLFLEREGMEKERDRNSDVREKHQPVVSRVDPDRGHYLEHRHVPWLLINPATLSRSVGEQPTNWAPAVRFPFIPQLEIMTASCGCKRLFFPHLFHSSSYTNNQINRGRLTGDNVQRLLYHWIFWSEEIQTQRSIG